MQPDAPPADAPVVLVAFNRPGPLAQVVDAVRDARPPLVLAVLDGPRSGHPTDRERCDAVRALIENTDFGCEVRLDRADTNMGLARRVVSGLDWAFDQVDRAIILEDDCVPAPDLFPFCAALLERYRDDERVGSVTGYNVLGRHSEEGASYFFSVHGDIWGWATWRRAWSRFDYSMSRWPAVRDSRVLDDVAPGLGVHDALSELFERTYCGDIDSWGYRWMFTTLMERMLSAVTAENLVRNIGFGSDATHTSNDSWLAHTPMGGVGWPLRHPTDFIPRLRFEKGMQDSLTRGRSGRRERARHLLADAVLQLANKARPR